MNQTQANWIAAVGLVVALLIPTVIVVRNSRLRAERQSVVNSARQIALALLNYADTYSSLPPTSFTNAKGEEAVSWRGATPNFIQAGPLWDVDLYQSWDGERNHRALLELENYAAFCSQESSNTRFLAIAGDGTALGTEEPGTTLDSDTILFIEVAESGRHWLAPGDLTLDQIPDDDTPASTIPGLANDEFVVGFVDGQVWRQSTAMPCSVLRKFLLVSEAKKHDRESLLTPYRIQ